MTAPTPFAVAVEASGPFANIAVLTLEQPGKPVVVLDHDLIRRLDVTLDVLPRSLVGLVLASGAPRAFVAGADLKAIQELDDDQLHKYLRYASGVFGKLSQLRYPTAAAIHGAVLGGGLELAMHCDALIGAPPPSRDGQPGKPYPVGLPEAGLSICPGWGGTCLLPARMDAADAIRRTATGKVMAFDEAVSAGMFDTVAPDAGSLLDTARGWIVRRAAEGRIERDEAPSRHVGRSKWAAKAVSALDLVRPEISAGEPGRAVALAVDAGLARGWAACLEVEQRELVRLRHTPAAKAAISAFFAKAAPSR